MANSQGHESDGDRRLSFGRLLADAMKVRGMKQEDLASMLGTTQSSVSGWINGKYEPAAETVFTVERCLGVEPGALSRALGYLPVEGAARAVSIEGAIAQSPLLDDEEKAALVSMYRVLATRGTRGANGARPRSRVQASRPRSVAGGG